MAKRHGRVYRTSTKHPKRVGIHQYAAMLRGRMTPAEVVLWTRLQRVMGQWGVEFHSQGVVAWFIGDFVCYERRLIIEVNGSIHNKRSVKRKDAYRSIILKRLGYRILVVTNKEVLTNCSAVLTKIRMVVLRD